MLLELSSGLSGWCFPTNIRYDGPNEYQDLDTFRHSAIDLPLLYATGRGETVCFQGFYFDSALFLSAGTNDRDSRASVRSFVRYASVCWTLSNGPGRLIGVKT